MEECFIEKKGYDRIDSKAKDLDRGVFEKCNFNQCDFSKAEIAELKFIECEFVECNLSLANLTGSSLHNVRFDDCKLLGVRFDTCNKFGLPFSFSECFLHALAGCVGNVIALLSCHFCCVIQCSSHENNVRQPGREERTH